VSMLNCNLDGEVVTKKYKPMQVASIRWAYNTAKGLKKRYNLSDETFCNIFSDLLESKEIWLKSYVEKMTGVKVRT